MHTNFEFKAQCQNIHELEPLLQPFSPQYIGQDVQVDTYFNVPNGRLKLREGNIENALIHYVRSNTANAKTSKVLLYQHQPDKELKQILTTALGVKVVVQKTRRIWFIDNVKFHFDTVAGLGSFVEVEAIDKEGTIGEAQLQKQCAFYANLFNIQPQQYVAHSYSDMMLNKSI